MNHRDTIPYVNLVPTAQIEHRQRSRWITRWSVMAAGITVLVGLPGLYIGGSAALTDSGMSGQIRETRSQFVSHQQAIPKLQERLRLLRAEQEVLELVKNRIEWRALFAVLVETAGDDVRFSGLAATGGGVAGDMPIEINLRGIAPSQTAARDYVVRLESMGLFDRVRLVETRRQMIEDYELIEFRLQISVIGEEAEGGSDAG